MQKTIRYILSWFAILLLSPCLTNAQVLYRISGNSTKSPSYLFATNKIAGIELLDSVPQLLTCFADCKKVITEFAMQDYEALATLRTAALLPDSIRLDRYFTDEEYRSIDEALQLSVGMSLGTLSRMKPSYLVALHRDALLKQWLDYDAARSMESFFQALAADKSIPVIGLDDIGETMYMLFDREPFEHQCKELLQVVNYPEREVRFERETAALYRQGYLTEIAFHCEAPDNLSTVSYSDYQVFAARNKEWVKRLRPYLLEGGCFLTLDALYIGGDKGLLSALRTAGYRIKPVNGGIIF